jgi:hypothetical protein
MQKVFEKSAVAVRFGTEKIVGFPRLTATFGLVLYPDSSVGGEEISGAHLRIVGRAKC